MNTLNFSLKNTINKLEHINYEFDADDGIIWVYLDAFPKPCVTPQLVDDIRSLHRCIEINNGQLPIDGELQTVKYHVLDSHADGIFSLGGDLNHFLNCIKNEDKIALEKYAANCIKAIYPIMTNFNLPIVTISLVRGNALGGGFEIALSGDVIIAERSAMMGFPEILFNCFPGMGAFQTLSSRVGLNKAHKLISSGNLYSAEELYDMGIVDILVDDHQGEEAVYSYVHNHNKNWNGNMAMQKIVQSLNNYDQQELLDICCNSWVDTVFDISEKDTRTINRLLRSQKRYESEYRHEYSKVSVS
ncbi:MAG: DSF synthase [Gammaproteobacteria bacterium]|jgi:DSF synthase